MLNGKKPLLYSFQGSLPKLPVPSIPDTMTRVSIMVHWFIVFGVLEILYCVCFCVDNLVHATATIYYTTTSANQTPATIEKSFNTDFSHLVCTDGELFYSNVALNKVMNIHNRCTYHRLATNMSIWGRFIFGGHRANFPRNK